jgi:hypothetical protein
MLGQQKGMTRKMDEDAAERKWHAMARSDLTIKYFAEKVSPAVHDSAAKKEAFAMWKEFAMHQQYLRREQVSLSFSKKIRLLIYIICITGTVFGEGAM